MFTLLYDTSSNIGEKVYHPQDRWTFSYPPQAQLGFFQLLAPSVTQNPISQNSEKYKFINSQT